MNLKENWNTFVGVLDHIAEELGEAQLDLIERELDVSEISGGTDSLLGTSCDHLNEEAKEAIHANIERHRILLDQVIH